MTLSCSAALGLGFCMVNKNTDLGGVFVVWVLVLVRVLVFVLVLLFFVCLPFVKKNVLEVFWGCFLGNKYIFNGLVCFLLKDVWWKKNMFFEYSLLLFFSCVWWFTGKNK